MNGKSGWSEGDFGKTWTGENPFNPRRAEQLELIVELAKQVEPKKILDLGCGPGLVAECLLTTFPTVSYVGVDVSSDCLERAKNALSDYGSRVQCFKIEFDGIQEQISDTFDLILAIQSVHHLNAHGKSRLFGFVKSRLKPGGLFILSDRIEMAHTKSLDQYLTVENFARTSGNFEPFPDQYSIREYDDRHLEHGDTPDTIEFHLTEIRRTGLQADCIWQCGFRAIIIAH